MNIAAAILHRPALLILDEPTVGVDVDARNGLHEVILHLSHAGMGVLLATHDLDQAETLCSTVGFLRKGIVDPQGPPRQLISASFANKKELILELRQLASQAQETVLTRAGFSPVNGGYSWTMLATGPDQSIEKVSSALDLAGIEAREIRYREPGLDSLFVRLSREQAGAA